MASSLLAAVRQASLADVADDDPVRDEPGADAPHSSEEEMAMSTNDDKPAGNRQGGGISQADHSAAVSAAHDAGVQAATERFSSILTAEGIGGDAARMTAAFDLAVKSPSMPAADVASFVVTNVHASTGSDASTYEADRLAAAGAAQPRAPAGASVQAGWDKAVGQANARFGKDAA